jgi:integrase
MMVSSLKKQNVPTVDEYIKVSFALHSGNRCDSTKYAYARNYDKYIKHVFGHRKLDKITGNDITFWQNNLQEKERLARSSIMKIRTILYSMFEDAKDSDIIKFNPCNKSKKLKETVNSKVKREKLMPFTDNEIKSILYAIDEQDKCMIATFFMTGLRAGELIGLKWDAIDFENKTITIRSQIVNGVEKNILKTTKSRRIIPIINSLLFYLKKQYEITGSKNSYVFLTKKTKKHYHSAGKIREQIWIKALKKANVKYRNLHQTRGTFISKLISSGEDINYVSKIAGHENVRVTLERYSEYIPCKNENFGDCFKKLNVC